MNESKDETEKATQKRMIAGEMDLLKRDHALEERIIALERALEALLKKEELSKLNLHGGDGEWY